VRPEQAGDEVEERRLARAVRADDADRLPGPHLEGDAVDGADAAERPRQVLDLEKRARGRRRRSGGQFLPVHLLPRSPCGRKRTSSRRNRSGAPIRTAVPAIAPATFAMPPITTIVSARIETTTPKTSGLM